MHVRSAAGSGSSNEVKAFEATVTAVPMNQLALASAKRDPADLDADTARLERPEAWAAATNASDAMRVPGHPPRWATALLESENIVPCRRTSRFGS